MGDKTKSLEMLSLHNRPDRIKARIFANLKMKDSMYYYIDKYISNNNSADRVLNPIIRIQQLMSINSRFEFDPYRNEPRYKAILKANYFPVSDE